jgi:uncharacterized membrane protein
MQSNEPTLFSYTLKRPLSCSPKLLLSFMGSLSFICLAIASVWAYLGAHWVLVFAVVDVLALTAAVIWCVRHALDQEHIVLTANTVAIERQLAGRIEHWSMERFYVRLNRKQVSLGPFNSPRLEVSARRQGVVLGGFCSAAALRQLETQLKFAMQTTNVPVALSQPSSNAVQQKS